MGRSALFGLQSIAPCSCILGLPFSSHSTPDNQPLMKVKFTTLSRQSTHLHSNVDSCCHGYQKYMGPFAVESSRCLARISKVHWTAIIGMPTSSHDTDGGSLAICYAPIVRNYRALVYSIIAQKYLSERRMLNTRFGSIDRVICFSQVSVRVVRSWFFGQGQGVARTIQGGFRRTQ